jgi:hypothetical protein
MASDPEWSMANGQTTDSVALIQPGGRLEQREQGLLQVVAPER